MSIFIVVFYEIFIKLRCIFNLAEPLTGNFYDITHPRPYKSSSFL